MPALRMKILLLQIVNLLQLVSNGQLVAIKFAHGLLVMKHQLKQQLQLSQQLS
jgi:hypothetical protein